MSCVGLCVKIGRFDIFGVLCATDVCREGKATGSDRQSVSIFSTPSFLTDRPCAADVEQLLYIFMFIHCFHRTIKTCFYNYAILNETKQCLFRDE